MSVANTTVKYANPLIQYCITGESLKTVVRLIKASAVTYTPCTVKWRGNPAFQPGDSVSVYDRKGTVHTVLIQSQTLTISGGMSANISCPGEPSEDIDTTPTTPTTESMNQSEEQQKEYADEQSAGALSEAKAYTNEQTAHVLTLAKNYTDDMLKQAKQYTDEQIALAITTALEGSY